MNAVDRLARLPARVFDRMAHAVAVGREPTLSSPLDATALHLEA
jgi:hypothetical protein